MEHDFGLVHKPTEKEWDQYVSRTTIQSVKTNSLLLPVPLWLLMQRLPMDMSTLSLRARCYCSQFRCTCFPMEQFWQLKPYSCIENCIYRVTSIKCLTGPWPGGAFEVSFWGSPGFREFFLLWNEFILCWRTCSTCQSFAISRCSIPPADAVCFR